jgi:hypothetical protein
VLRACREIRGAEAATTAGELPDGPPVWQDARFETAMVGVLARAASRGSWQAAAFLLSHAYPERWGPQRLAGKLPRPRQDDEDGPDPFAEIDELARRRRERPTT